MTGSRVGHGLVLGKFYPPHAGHHRLVRAAAAACDQVTVLVAAASVESIPLADRVAWLRAEHASDPGVTVVGVLDDAPIDMHDDQVWAAHVAVFRAALAHHGRPAVDVVVSGEQYGDELARRLGARHLVVDRGCGPDRLSGTRCRADLAAAWDELAPATRAGLAARVVVIGSESTGTTTVARGLAAAWASLGGNWTRTRWVPEWGREATWVKLAAAQEAAARRGEPAPSLDGLVWTADDFAAIAERQTAMEDRAAADGSPLLVCDTDAFATLVWERRYLGPAGTASAPWAGPLLPRRDLYLVTDHDGVPFEQDGIRDGEHVRAEMTSWFTEALTAAGHPWVLLTGTREERMVLAVRSVEECLDRRMTFAEPLEKRSVAEASSRH